jgi:hypothetical protein
MNVPPVHSTVITAQDLARMNALNAILSTISTKTLACLIAPMDTQIIILLMNVYNVKILVISVLAPPLINVFLVYLL